MEFNACPNKLSKGSMHSYDHSNLKKHIKTTCFNARDYNLNEEKVSAGDIFIEKDF